MMNHRAYPPSYSFQNNYDGTEANDSWNFQKGQSFQRDHQSQEQEYNSSFNSFQGSNHEIPSTPAVSLKMNPAPLITEMQFLEHYQKSQLSRRSTTEFPPYASSNQGMPYMDPHLGRKFIKSYSPQNCGQSQQEIHKHVQPLYDSSHDYYELKNILSIASTDDQMDIKGKLELDFLEVRSITSHFSIVVPLLSVLPSFIFLALIYSIPKSFF